MSSFDMRQNSMNTGGEVPGAVNQLSPVEQLTFPDSSPGVVLPLAGPLSFPGATGPLSEPISSPGMTRPLPEPISSPKATGQLSGFSALPVVTRPLPELWTGALPSTQGSKTTSLRTPVVIRGGGKKSTGTMRPPTARPMVLHIAVVGVILVLALGTAMAVAPAGGESGHGFSLFQPVFNLIQSHGGGPNPIAQQAQATATAAVTHQDGFDPGGQGGLTTGAGSGTLVGGGGPGRFAFGQCTYWANLRYHELTGYYVPWLGNAYQWAYGAGASGWVVSSKPKLPSIIVLAPYVEGAGPYGHVAIVEHINADGSVYTSNFNWYANGGWDRLSYVTFHPGPGVTFVWHP